MRIFFNFGESRSSPQTKTKEMDSDEESLESLGGFRRKVEQISSERITETTRKNYISKLKAWKKWMRQYKPEGLGEDGELLLPVQKENMILFFGSIVYKDAQKTKMRAHSTVMGYYSALKYYYSMKEVPFNGSEQLTSFLTGYQKQTARARENGELPSFEGKLRLSS